MTESLGDFCLGVESKLGEKDDMLQWKQAIEARLTAVIASLPLNQEYAYSHKQQCISLTSQDKTSLKQFQKHVVITLLDKNASNFAFICIHQYARLLINDLNQSTTFVKQAGPPGGLKLVDLPRYYATIKAHKDPPSLRMISASSDVATTALSTSLNRLFNRLRPELEILVHEAFKGTPRDILPAQFENPTHSNTSIVDNACGFIDVLHYFSRISSTTGLGPTAAGKKEVFDIERCFTALPHHDILEQIGWLVDIIFKRHTSVTRSMPTPPPRACRRPRVPESLETLALPPVDPEPAPAETEPAEPVILTKVLQIFDDEAVNPVWLDAYPRECNKSTKFRGKTKRGQEGQQSQTLYFTCYDAAFIMSQLAFLLKNTYVTFLGMVYLQVCGIPMGTNSAPNITTFLLFCYEYRFLLQVVDQARRLYSIGVLHQLLYI